MLSSAAGEEIPSELMSESRAKTRSGKVSPQAPDEAYEKP